MADKYASIAELESTEACGRDYRLHVIDRPAAAVIVLAPHGGTIEIGTSELAGRIAGTEHSLFAFEGLKELGRNRDLHITSHRFDHPACVELTRRHSIVIAVHGCRGDSHIYCGGLDTRLAALIGVQLTTAGIAVSLEGHRYPGRNPLNICNRGARSRGVQLELTNDLRREENRGQVAAAVRCAIDAYRVEIMPPHAYRRRRCN